MQTYAVTVTRADAAPTVTSVGVNSDPGDDETYDIGDTIHVVVVFDAPVTVDTSGGTPRIRLRIGSGDPEHLKWTDYFSGLGDLGAAVRLHRPGGRRGHRRHLHRGGRSGAQRRHDPVRPGDRRRTRLHRARRPIGPQGGRRAPDARARHDPGRRPLDRHRLQRAPGRDHRAGLRLHAHRGPGHGAGGQQRHGDRQQGDARAGRRVDGRPGRERDLRRPQFGRRLCGGPGRGRQRRRQLHHWRRRSPRRRQRCRYRVLRRRRLLRVPDPFRLEPDTQRPRLGRPVPD